VRESVPVAAEGVSTPGRRRKSEGTARPRLGRTDGSAKRNTKFFETQQNKSDLPYGAKKERGNGGVIAVMRQRAAGDLFPIGRGGGGWTSVYYEVLQKKS